jgi:hypothetical protein
LPHDRPERESSRDAALAAIGVDVAAFCATRLARVAGTHGLFLDGLAMPLPAVAGVARWTTLVLTAGMPAWRGTLRAATAELPFVDDSFCAILACPPGDGDADVAAELARVLAPHGTMLVAGLHPRSLWRCGVAPGRWERLLREAGLDVRPAARCGAPWPRTRGAAGLPRWLARGFGGAWVVEARRSVLATLPLRKPVVHRAVEHGTLMPGAHRQCA